MNGVSLHLFGLVVAVVFRGLVVAVVFHGLVAPPEHSPHVFLQRLAMSFALHLSVFSNFAHQSIVSLHSPALPGLVVPAVGGVLQKVQLLQSMW